MYEVEFTRPALKELQKIDKDAQRSILGKIETLKRDPRPRGTEKLKGHNDRFRVRVGNYRIIYTIIENKLLIIILHLGNRKDIYRK